MLKTIASAAKLTVVFIVALIILAFLNVFIFNGFLIIAQIDSSGLKQGMLWDTWAYFSTFIIPCLAVFFAYTIRSKINKKAHK